MPNLFGYDINIKKKVSVTGPVIPEAVEGNFMRYMEAERIRTGKSDTEILESTFNLNPWLGVSIEETGGANLRLDMEASGYGQNPATMKKDIKDIIEDCIRLRKKFAPISTCIDYVKEQLVGGGIESIIKDPKDKNQIKMKEDIDIFMEQVYQDSITIGLDIMLPILVDYALTTGVGAAEIAYIKNTSFWDYATLDAPEQVTIDGKSIDVMKIKVSEPTDWTVLQGIKRLKIFPNAYKIFEPERNKLSMEIDYWNVINADDKTKVTLSNGQTVTKYDPANPKNGLYLQNWQLFYLSINREEFEAKGTSIILPVYSIAIILEKILAAVGEGNSRAGFKRFFLIMGSEKRPWGGPFIRNVLKQMQEAREKNWSTIPMPQGFDIKEMGGEVFDAKEVVDYCLRMIAKAMNCPATILGVSIRDTGVVEPSSNYTLWKNNLKSAIRNQLYMRHLWAMHGKTKGKQGGKSEADLYIPFPRIKVEGLLTLKEETDIFKELMNFANPLDPIMKYKAQIQYCKSLGWMDVIEQMPTIEEYSKELEDAKKLALKQQADAAKQAKVNAEAPKKDPNANPLGESMQGAPKPPNAEQLAKRQEGGVNVRPADSKKGIIASKTP